MIYAWHLLIKWSLAYPTSALVADIIVGVLFVMWIVWILMGKTDDESERKSWRN